MNILNVTKDGGPESKVWAYWLIEIKCLFSIVLLRFENGSREAFHTHAFNAISWVLGPGCLIEWLHSSNKRGPLGIVLHKRRRPYVTPRTRFHMVESRGRTWVLSFRGPWSKTWNEYLPASDQYKTLTHGRIEV